MGDNGVKGDEGRVVVAPGGMGSRPADSLLDLNRVGHYRRRSSKFLHKTGRPPAGSAARPSTTRGLTRSRRGGAGRAWPSPYEHARSHWQGSGRVGRERLAEDREAVVEESGARLEPRHRRSTSMIVSSRVIHPEFFRCRWAHSAKACGWRGSPGRKLRRHADGGRFGLDDVGGVR
jgi:hypothetical protein